MKKIILSAAFLAIACFTTVSASEVKNPTTYVVQQDSTTKTAVAFKDLPDSVKATLASEPFKAWLPTGAFLVTNADKTIYYQVDVKKEEEVKSLKITADGKVIE